MAGDKVEGASGPESAALSRLVTAFRALLRTLWDSQASRGLTRTRLGRPFLMRVGEPVGIPNFALPRTLEAVRRQHGPLWDALLRGVLEFNPGIQPEAATSVLLGLDWPRSAEELFTGPPVDKVPDFVRIGEGAPLTQVLVTDPRVLIDLVLARDTAWVGVVSVYSGLDGYYAKRGQLGADGPRFDASVLETYRLLMAKCLVDERHPARWYTPWRWGRDWRFLRALRRRAGAGTR